MFVFISKLATQSVSCFVNHNTAIGGKFWKTTVRNKPWMVMQLQIMLSANAKVNKTERLYLSDKQRGNSFILPFFSPYCICSFSNHWESDKCTTLTMNLISLFTRLYETCISSKIKQRIGSPANYSPEICFNDFLSSICRVLWTRFSNVTGDPSIPVEPGALEVVDAG